MLSTSTFTVGKLLYLALSGTLNRSFSQSTNSEVKSTAIIANCTLGEKHKKTDITTAAEADGTFQNRPVPGRMIVHFLSRQREMSVCHTVVDICHAIFHGAAHDVA